MKRKIKIILTALFVSLFFSSYYGASAQKIKLVASYDNNNSYTSGLYAVGDTALYRYSWYGQHWFPLSNNGLNRINDTVQISAFAVYNNFSDNSSGLFVFSDTAVYNYNWFISTWFYIPNTGLPRINLKPNVRNLTVYGDSGSSSNSSLFAITDTALFLYSWYLQEWSPIPNTGIISGLNKIKDNPSQKIDAFPNPFSDKISIELNIPLNSSGNIELAFFDMKGHHVYSETHKLSPGSDVTIIPSLSSLTSGIYMCEIWDGKNYNLIKVIKIR